MSKPKESSKSESIKYSPMSGEEDDFMPSGKTNMKLVEEIVKRYRSTAARPKNPALSMIDDYIAKDKAEKRH